MEIFMKIIKRAFAGLLSAVLLMGLAGLARGDSAAAQSSFLEASSVSSDPLAWLGLGTANVIAGDDGSAQHYYRRALEADPTNKTAARNLKVLAQ